MTQVLCLNWTADILTIKFVAPPLNLENTQQDNSLPLLISMYFLERKRVETSRGTLFCFFKILSVEMHESFSTNQRGNTVFLLAVSNIYAWVTLMLFDKNAGLNTTRKPCFNCWLRGNRSLLVFMSQESFHFFCFATNELLNSTWF